MIAILRELLPGVDVLWAPAERPRESSTDLVVVRVISGPTTESPSLTFDEVPTNVRVTVNSAEDGQSYALYATGAVWRIEADSDDEPTDIRDAFIVALDEEQPGLRATISPEGANSLRIAGVALGDLWGFGASGDITVENVAVTDAMVQTAHAVFRLEVQAFGGPNGRYPRAGAANLIGEIIGGLYHPDIREMLDEYGVTIWGSPSSPTDLTAIAGAKFESRSAFQLTVATRSYSARPVETIADLALTVSTDQGSVTVTVSSE